MAEERVTEEKKNRIVKTEKKGQSPAHTDGSGPEGHMQSLQQTIGNRAVQRLLAQRKGDGPFEVDDDTADRINHERSSGQALDEGTADQMGAAMGQDFSGVRVHTSPEAADLNQQLSAKAFTTGQDIFFSQGSYSPQSSAGQELLAHELTHVAQQGSGAVGGGSSQMTVNAPGDAFEQQADSVSQSVLSGASAGLQRQDEDEMEDIHKAEAPEEEEPLPIQKEEEVEDEDNTAIQQQELDEDKDETALQKQSLEDENEDEMQVK